MNAYLIQEMEFPSSRTSIDGGFISGVIAGVVLADSPEEVDEVLGGKYLGDLRSSLSRVIHIPEELLSAPDPSYLEGDPLHNVSWYRKGSLKIPTRRKGGITLVAKQVPILNPKALANTRSQLP